MILHTPIQSHPNNGIGTMGRNPKLLELSRVIEPLPDYFLSFIYDQKSLWINRDDQVFQLGQLKRTYHAVDDFNGRAAIRPFPGEQGCPPVQLNQDLLADF